MVVIVECHGAEQLQATLTVFHFQIVVSRPLPVVGHLAECLYAKAVTLRKNGLDADNGIHLGIVLGTRRGDDVHPLDVVRLQLFQFLSTLHFFVVDVDFGRTFGKDGEVAITTLYLWQHRKHIVSGADIFQQRVLNINGHAARSHLVLRYLAFNSNSFQCHRLWMHPYCTKFRLITKPIDGFVAHV